MSLLSIQTPNKVQKVLEELVFISVPSVLTEALPFQLRLITISFQIIHRKPIENSLFSSYLVSTFSKTVTTFLPFEYGVVSVLGFKVTYLTSLFDGNATQLNCFDR